MSLHDDETISFTPYGFLNHELKGETDAYNVCDLLWNYMDVHNLALIAGEEALQFVDAKKLFVTEGKP